MKKFFQIVVICICGLAVCACPNSDPIIVKQDVTVTFKLSGINSAFTPYKVSDFSVDDAKAQLHYFLYNSQGSRVNDATVSLNDLSGETSVDLTLSGEEDYTIVAFAYYISANSITFYSFSDTESIKTLTVTQQDEHKYSDMSSALGYGSTTLNSRRSSTIVSLEPANALVYLEWEDIHAKRGGGTPTYPLYGDYTATAKDIWGESHTWTIIVEKGSSANEVIIKNLLPYFVENGWSWSPEHNVNIFTGTYNASAATITLPMKQPSGLVYGEEQYSVQLVGGRSEGEYIYYEDLVLSVENGKLITQNLFGAVAPDDTSEDAGWWDLFEPGVVFNSQATPTGGGGEPDEYLILYHKNDVMHFNGGSPTYSTTLGEVNYSSDSVSPAQYSLPSVYGIVYLFPGKIKIFGRGYTENQPFDDTAISSVSLSEGEQYVFSLDCGAMTISGWRGTLATKSDLLLPAIQTWDQDAVVLYAPRARGKKLFIDPNL